MNLGMEAYNTLFFKIMMQSLKNSFPAREYARTRIKIDGLRLVGGNPDFTNAPGHGDDDALNLQVGILLDVHFHCIHIRTQNPGSSSEEWPGRFFFLSYSPRTKRERRRQWAATNLALAREPLGRELV